jgi:hypothetical protein
LDDISARIFYTFQPEHISKLRHRNAFLAGGDVLFRPTVQPQGVLAAEPYIGWLLVHVFQKALLGFQPDALEAWTECSAAAWQGLSTEGTSSSSNPA